LEGFKKMLRKFLRVLGLAALVCGGMVSLPCNKSEAAVMTPPFATDTFLSSFNVSLYLQPGCFGLPQEVLVQATGSDFPGTSTTVLREINAFTGYCGTDTVNTEFISMHLAGGVVTPGAFYGTPVHFKVGQNNGFRSGLGLSPGQVAENIGTPINGLIDVFPTKSLFDLFLDIWVDVDSDGLVEDGEVLRNYDQSLRMENSTLRGFPPPPGDFYTSTGSIGKNNSSLGEFSAPSNLSTSRINFFVVNPDGSNSNCIAAQLDPLASDTHLVTPEPTSIVLFGGLMVMPILRRFRKGKRTLSV
jgi:hypothetical protein